MSELPEMEPKAENTIQISVVIATYNRVDVIKDCIDSILSQDFPKDRYEIIIIDSSSDDSVKKIIDEYYPVSNPKIQYFYQKREGLASARNLGIEKAVGDIVYFFDDDCILDKNCLNIISSSYDSKEIAGIEGGVAGYHSSTIIQKYGDFLYHRTDTPPGGIIPGMDGPIGCNASYRKDVLTEVQGFDKQFKWMEDLEIAIKIRKKGYYFKFIPSALVYHKHRVTLTEVLKRAYNFCYIGTKLCCDKYPELYSVKKIILRNCVRIAYKIVIYPYVIVTVFQADDKKFHLCKPFIDILVSTYRISGLTAAVIHGIKYVNNDSNS